MYFLPFQLNQVSGKPCLATILAELAKMSHGCHQAQATRNVKERLEQHIMAEIRGGEKVRIVIDWTLHRNFWYIKKLKQIMKKELLCT